MMLPARTRLCDGDFILDIIEADYGKKIYYFTVHRNSSGEILALGSETSFEAAKTSATKSIYHLYGKELNFVRTDDSTGAA